MTKTILWKSLKGFIRKQPTDTKWFKFAPPVHVPQYVESMLSNYRKSKGKIIAWGWFQSVKAFIIKRERGVECYENCKALQTLPYFDWMAMAR